MEGRIGARLRAARVAARLTQEELAERMGFEHRQTLGAVENGERKLSAEELLRVIDLLDVDLDYFTDGFRLVGEGVFSFRTHPDVLPESLQAFSLLAGNWVATYRELGVRLGEPPRWLDQKLALTARASYEQVQQAAEALVEQWDLGGCPADRLAGAMERELGALVLYVDAPVGISGAALQLPGLHTVLVNRAESPVRRNYDLAHELFHLLTWAEMPPERVERTGDGVPRGSRVEQLAENFAAALLMPAQCVRRHWASFDPSGDIHAWINATAEDLRVSSVACKWRVHNLGLLSRAALAELDDRRLTAAPNGGPSRAFSTPFVSRIARGLAAGHLSVKRAAALLGMSMGDLASLLAEHGFEPEFEV